MKKRVFINILLSFGLVVLVASLGSLFVNLGMDWFNKLEKPSAWIPNFVIPIMWTVVYTIFAIIIFMWLQKGSISKSVKILLILNGILNILWCLVFFTLNLTFIGFIAIIINLIFGFYLILEIKKLNSTYFYWTLIYPAWLSIATALNVALWILN